MREKIMNLKKTYIPSIGYTKICEIGKCSLHMLEFGIIELKKRDKVTIETKECEYAFIFLGGRALVQIEGEEGQVVGGRRNVFEDKRADSVYVPKNRRVMFTGCEHVKIAVCNTPVEEDSEPQILPASRVTLKTLGVKPWERDTSFIIDSTTNAKRLTIGEAYITPGNWAGFPPHKHDVENMPDEGILEEIYYFLFQPDTGFGVQCLYTADGEIDEAYRVQQDDLVEFPRGYHTTVGAPGYNTYFLWLMAGDHQGFFRSNDPSHEWVAAVENMVKKYTL